MVNGLVVLYEIFEIELTREHVVSLDRIYKEHQRAVNRICWHPTEANQLFSASQDGTVKLWDKRSKNAFTYYPKSESIRDVQCSLFQKTKFAVAFENGLVQVSHGNRIMEDRGSMIENGDNRFGICAKT